MARTPRPTALKLVRGERKDRINHAEPLPDDVPIKPPALSAEARKVWNRYAPDLTRKQVLTAWDVDALGSYCDAVVRLGHARSKLDEQGEVVEESIFNREGDIVGYKLVRSPWMLVWKAANEVILRQGARFGLTPSDRSQLKVGDAKKKDPAADLLSS